MADQPRGADERGRDLRRPAVLGLGVERLGDAARGADADGDQGGLRSRRRLQAPSASCSATSRRPSRSTHQVVMQRCCWTMVVLIGSSSWPPSRSVQLEQHRLVDDEAIRAVRKAHAPAAPDRSRLEADVRREPREQAARPGASTRHISSSIRSKCATSSAKCSTALQTTASIAARPRAGDRARRCWKFSAGRCGASYRGGERAHMGDGRRVAVDAEAVEAAAQQIGEVPSVAAAGVEHAPAVDRSGRAAADRTGRCRCRRSSRAARRSAAPQSRAASPALRRRRAQRRRQPGRSEQAHELVPPLAGARDPPRDSTYCFTRSLPRL